MKESGIQEKLAQDQAPHGPVGFSESHADLLDLFGRWEALADADVDLRVDGTLMPPYSGAARPR